MARPRRTGGGGEVRKPIIGLVAAVLAVGGYATADVYDRVPGILTLDRPTPLPAPTTPGPSPTPVPLPSPASALPLLAPMAADAPEPSQSKLKAALDAAFADPALGNSLGVSVRDVATGKALYARDGATPRVVASAQKILAAAAITSELDPHETMSTSVRLEAPGELVLVAGGDTLLAEGKGDPEAVAGHAGLADLAEQVATGLPAGTPSKVTLRLDMTYAAGPGYPDTPPYPTGWAAGDVALGFTQSVAMIGLAKDRPKPYVPSPIDPAAAVLKAFAGELTTAFGASGPAVTVTDDPATRAEPVPAEATLLGEVRSAAYQDVLALALDESDNALTENLARQAALQAGGDGSFSGNARFVTDRLATLGFDTSATTLKDTSGLSAGQSTTVDLLGEVTAAGLSGKLPGLGEALARLPVAGLDGTLHDRFLTGPAHDAAGIVRAKTGTLTGVSSLVGTTVDADDRQLMFVVVADRVPASSGTLAARGALDRAIAVLTACGCR